jgi:proteasome lid subunit RPN8/RPN11
VIDIRNGLYILRYRGPFEEEVSETEFLDGNSNSGDLAYRVGMRAPSAPHPVLSVNALDAIYAHARREYPKECCGIAWGRRDEPIADRTTPCENIQDRLHAEDPAVFMRDARSAYRLDVRDVRTLQQSLRGDAPARIVYHSHVDVGAYFSETDQAVACICGEPAYPVDYVVIDIRADGPCGAKQYAWDAYRRRYVAVGGYE